MTHSVARPIEQPRELNSPIAANDGHTRLLVQARAAHTKRRHFLKAVRRVLVLGVADVSITLGGRELVGAVHASPSLGEVVSTLFPDGFMAGWGSAAAIVMGLVFAGAYGSRERWASASVAVKGVALGSALALWQSLDSTGIAWTLFRWVVVVTLLGAGIAAMRHGLGLVILRHRFFTGRDRVIMVGDPESQPGRLAAKALAKRPGVDSMGWLSERAHVEDYLGHPSAVWEILCETGTDTVMLCGELSPELFETVVEAAAVAGCRVLSVRSMRTLKSTQPRALNGPDLRMLELTFPAARAGQDVIKRGLDLVVATALLLMSFPLLALVAIWIKLDSPGPVFFVQERVGQAGETFSMLKFRTMREGADRDKQALTHLNRSGDPRLFKIPDDPRVTRAGSFLRRWSLDELPQLFNVAQGRMSLVGPRPFFEADLAAYDDHHFIRLSVKPGVTGLWQVRGRSSIVDFEEVVHLDREYVENWSVWLDLKILLATLPAVVRRRGAF